MRCLFRFNLAGETQGGDEEAAEGIGHAVRCLALADTLATRTHAEVLLLADGNPAAARFLAQCRYPFILSANEFDKAKEFRPDVIIIDINYMSAERIERLRSLAPVINLAPRGLPKFYADATISNVAANDVVAPTNVAPRLWYRGPEYAIVHPRFRQSSMVPLGRQRVAVLMGGVDQAGLTLDVIKQLAALADDFLLEVVVGPVNPHIVSVTRQLAALRKEARLHVDPPDLNEILARASVAVLGTGNVVDEALTLGTPCVCVGLSSFHDLRGCELEQSGMIIYAGRGNDKSVARAVAELLRNRDLRAVMRRRALAAFDGLGCVRAVEIIMNLAKARWQVRAD